MNNMPESEIRERAKPYFYEAPGDTLAILIHGFSGTPDDLKELAKFLVAEGISVKAPLLAGHGRHWVDLEKTSHYDWWKSVEDEVLAAQGQYKYIFLIGYSFGGNLALDLAIRQPQIISGVVSLGISVFLKNDFWVRLGLPFAHFLFKSYRKRYIKKDQLPEYEASGAYAVLPTKSVYDLYYFINQFTKKELAKVTVPTLFIHSQDDAIANPLSSQYAHDRVGSKKKELIYLNDLNHNPLRSRSREIIFGKIQQFINAIRQN
ncbi:MAG: alpha/beta fold hydrolase [Candidatus Komeilibacteria bacterium]|nr:alpha/beta fold hydrolase [Candidatus Komeilibacteria bacterium]